MLGCSRLAALSTAIYIAVIIISLSGYGGASVVRERNNKLFQVVPSIAQEDERKCDAGVRDYLAKDKIEVKVHPSNLHLLYTYLFSSSRTLGLRISAAPGFQWHSRKREAIHNSSQLIISQTP